MSSSNGYESIDVEEDSSKLPFLRAASRDLIQEIKKQSHHSPVSMGEYIICPTFGCKNEPSGEALPLLEKQLSKDIPKSSVFSSTFTLTNTILGSGTLAVPYAIASSGWLLANMVMILLAVLTQYSVRLLLRASDLAGINSAKTYESLGHYTMGKAGTCLAEFTFIFGGFGTLVSYLIFISNLFTVAFNLPMSCNSWVLILCTIGIIMPLSLNRRIGKLQITSLLATLSVAYVVIFMVFVYAIVHQSDKNLHNQSRSDIQPIKLDSGSIFTVTLLIAAFACHNTTLPVYEELKDRSIQRMTKAVVGAITVAFILYEAIGISGYLLFGSDTKDNVLLNFTPEFLDLHPSIRTPLRVGQLCMAFALLLTCPIALWPFRSCLLSVFLRIKNKGVQTPSHDATRYEFVTMTLCSELAILFCAIYVPSVKTPLSLVGSISGSLIIFIMPSLFYMLQQPHSVFSLKNVGPLGMLFLGIIIGIVGFSLTVYRIFL